MITQKPTKQDLAEWKAIWEQYRDGIQPNRKSGGELLSYLQNHYVLTEIPDTKALACVSETIKLNPYLAEKLSNGATPIPRTFYVENSDKGEKLYSAENRDCSDLWGDELTKIFVGVDLTSGYYTVEGSTFLWDELCAFQGVDEKDLQNYVIVAQYINALKRFGRLGEITKG